MMGDGRRRRRGGAGAGVVAVVGEVHGELYVVGGDVGALEGEGDLGVVEALVLEEGQALAQRRRLHLGVVEEPHRVLHRLGPHLLLRRLL
jgi:hypothetical protein